jgi:hypothetical protein
MSGLHARTQRELEDREARTPPGPIEELNERTRRRRLVLMRAEHARDSIARISGDPVCPEISEAAAHEHAPHIVEQARLLVETWYQQGVMATTSCQLSAEILRLKELLVGVWAKESSDVVSRRDQQGYSRETATGPCSG